MDSLKSIVSSLSGVMANDKDGQTPFGHAMRSHFLLDPSYLPLNHGSFGTYPKPVRDRLRQIQDISELRPDAFFRYDLPKYIDSARAAIAEYLGVDAGECVFVPNATTGVNTVLRSLIFEKGDVIVYFSTIYGACEKTVEYIKETTPVQSAKIKLSYPIGDDELIEMFEQKIKQLKIEGKRPKVAIFDTVSSLPGVRMPFEKLVEICKREEVLSMLDGAHGAGHLDLNLGKVQPDFFVSNCHKWLYAPRGCAVFHVPERNHQLIRTSIPTSHGYEPFPSEDQEKLFNPWPAGKRSYFVELFQFVGTTDVGPYLCIEEALKFRQRVCGGEKRIMEYCEKISNDGGKEMALLLGTEVMENSEKTLTKCCLTNVKLPLTTGESKGEIKEEDAFAVIAWIAQKQMEEYNMFASPFFHAGSFWVRLSGQIYVELKDFVTAAERLKGLCERVRKGEYSTKDAA
ncbi:MAG: hypothetical protein LQ338_003170 [Usnochroma carphineum]|nr:MAG: hypothetical protein LQ338_003170 [Usnochroma carphineum]